MTSQPYLFPSFFLFFHMTPTPPPVRRRIIACMDGTWETPSARTNIYKWYENVLISRPIVSEDDRGKEMWLQVARYFPGVGTTTFKQFSGIFGLGISQQIIDAYVFLSENYRDENDEIWIIGYSRGAYAARSLAGMIYNVGLLPCKHAPEQISVAYRLYRNRDGDSGPKSAAALKFRTRYNCMDPKIRFLGCFDTVGTLGVPRLPWYMGGSLFWNLFHGLNNFHDTKISPIVKSAFHALSIHDQRAWFEPTLMRFTSKQMDGQELEQVWFPGMHSDVGGQEISSLLANHALRWMMTKAEERGFKFKYALYPIVPNSNEVIHVTYSFIDSPLMKYVAEGPFYIMTAMKVHLSIV
ncbi:uncharacterized protein BYT42DRAFT_572960 [Radiomyces spectabilis]|uniref:uncharacterized protein n=1 Tax=Radiomyces spectabilis TaxID=64574 RepID=UPI00221E46C3|nr:uncharacterized protein BYT42DRAFT_572960 [Radiomyces spectabilis]KAI8375976.1 hypothetical protein BYT42DRAFT_572960 [Radiomyces spectabilis]